jgi:NRAMP (natural resistance-associated macrophage protein)-like metal ion transporter
MTARKNLSAKNVEDGKGQNLLGRSLGVLGPGLITGAADDDPSGISTYSVAGAAYGNATLCIALLIFPLMAAIQLMCARLGLVTGRGLAAAVRVYYPRWVLWAACSILAVANVTNIGADLGGMAEATQLVAGIRSLIWILFYAFFITGLLIWIFYKLIARIFSWLTLVLFAYVFASFYAHVDWKHALAVTCVPHLEWPRGFLAVLVAILGTTISPYLFFWQAPEEVEEGRTKGRTLAERKGATGSGMSNLQLDVELAIVNASVVRQRGCSTRQNAAAAVAVLPGAIVRGPRRRWSVALAGDAAHAQAKHTLWR